MIISGLIGRFGAPSSLSLTVVLNQSMGLNAVVLWYLFNLVPARIV